jgi:hypothetical protein
MEVTASSPLPELARVLVRFDHICQPHCDNEKRFAVQADEKLTAFYGN